jgi:hypothetical protein
MALHALEPLAALGLQDNTIVVGELTNGQGSNSIASAASAGVGAGV